MAETNTAALRAQGERDARALTVTGRRRADTGRIRRAAKTLARMARAVTPETPNGQWLRDNRSFACAAAGDAVAALRRARVRASGGQTALGACCAGLLRACGGALTVKAAEAYLEGFQDALPLETAELALLVPGLQAAVVCALAESYAGDSAAAPALFTSLRALGTAAWGMLAERCDRVGRILARDPVGVYPAMDAATRAHYRQTVARLARRTGRTEIEIAEDVLARAQRSEGARRHVGWFLLREVLGAPERRRDGGWYIAAVVVGTLFLSLLLGFATKSVSGAVLLLIPVSEVVKGLLDAVLLRVTKPRFVPRLALRRGIPPEGRTLCVIAALLTSPDDAHALCARLEEYYLCNRDALGQLTFGLLADLPEADMAHAPIDPAILRAARAEIAALNARWGSRFYLFTRPRVQTPDGKWSARERKRGALLELARLVLDRPGTLQCAAGDAAGLSGTVYLLTLDADTRLTPGAARALVGAMLHPLNRAVVDAQRGVVTRGYGLLHPRMATELQSANATDWARVFAGPGGADPYGGACGELYMDCFDRGGFPGKGILDVRALLDCCGGGVIPEGRVLSHDALEGAYLHGGFLGDVELTDTFPAAPLAWGARAHRWIRGDWQNAPWIFSRRARALHPIDRFRLADNLRRSLVAPATWISIFLGCVLRWPGLRLAAYAALLALAQGLIRALGQPIVHPADTRVRYHSDVLHGLASAVAQTVLRLILLPWEAILNTSAIVTALWRMAVSHRNLLQWQTAAQRAGRRDGLGAYWRALWPASALGLLTAVLTPSPTGLAAGIVWMLSPFVLAALGAPNAAGAAPLSRAAQRELLGWAKATWQYFETFCTAEDHYLPPDNVQSQPPTGTAHRTSPTNMGLALVSALGAHALGIDDGQGLALAERMLTTMEQLPRWNGHFYNWYHTCTLRPMPPLYVSTVDSGNCAAALLTAANALRGWGRDELAARAQMLCDGMDFGPLYDPQRRLMHIGIDTGSGKWSESYYDLLSSEARLTSYFAVARGDVPREHWRALSRAQVQKDHYRGCVSWSGSMFEYLMPELFLPPVRDSLLWESAKFCLYVQRRRVRPGQAWGVSESAYFALDSALSYRYKAHGCAALALQPGMDKELVLSPYSSFLALAVEPRAAMRNLRRLAALGLLGQHGFFDALDCTRARTGGGGQIVRCVMAHHQGMSLLAACNALCGDQVRRWFFADPAMRAHATLLSERLPLGAPALRRRAEQPAEKARRRALPDYAAEGTGIDAEAPRCALLSNGTYCLAVSEAGQSFARWHALSVCRRGTRADPAAGPVVRLETDDFSGPLLPGTAAGAQWRFTVRAAQFTARHGDVTAVQTLTVPGRANGEVRALTLSSPRGIEGTVRFVFEAVLAPWEDYVNHPAFARLGFQSVLRRDALLLRHLGRGEKPEAWLCAACDRPGTWRAEGPVPGWLRAGRVELSVPVHTAPDTPWRVRFALGVGAREDDAFTAAQRALVLPPAMAAALPAELAAQYGMTGAELDGAMAAVSPLLFPAVAAGAVSLFDDDGAARVEYGFGWAAWERSVDGMSVRVTAFVPEDADARVLLIECAGRARITWHTDLVCAGRDADAPAVVTAYADGLFTAENVRADAPELFCAAAGMPLTGWTCDRFSFLRGQMDARAGAGLSPCFALEGVIDRQGVIVCGCDTRANLLRLTQPDEAAHALRATRERWLGAVSRLWMTTPDADMNRYLGGWAAYQALCCRLLARTSLYQNGGAFGFRDQLQDAVNLLLLDSAPAREQIGRACAHQFAAGDVCHWWHAGTGPEHGVRTRISDDLLWLPWAVCEYVEKTGDAEILSAEYPFLAGEELEENEHDRYQPLEAGAETGTVLEHCRRALMRVLARGAGAHGLLLIGTGDWNDAFDRVGAQGRGESVWLTWFFAITARKFAALVGGHAAEQLALAADHCTRAAEGAWDGAWYRRGYYDDGRPLGSEACGECRIDAIAQAFAALDTHADPGRVHTALTSAVEHLFDREHNVVRLFDPPITRRTPETGYVRSYGAGLRENGGQYTHGALWLAMALLRTGRTAEGAEILHAVLPAAHDPARYEGEPYVLATDIAGGDNAGVAGWTWYTGAAGWYLRIAAEDLLGLHLRGGVLYPEPHLPAGWPECTVRWRDGAGLLHTVRLRPDGVTVDNAPYDGGGIGKKRPKPYSQDR